MPSMVLGAGDTVVSKTKSLLFFHVSGRRHTINKINPWDVSGTWC